MFFLYKSFAFEAFKSHLLISSASVFAEATLHIRDKLVFFQVPDLSLTIRSTILQRQLVSAIGR